MALLRWVGGAATVAQIDKAVFAAGAGWANGDQVTFQLRDQGNTLHTEVTTLNNPTSNENAVDQVLAQLTGSSDPEFLKVTWTKEGTTTIVGTAVTAGIPFHLAISETSTNGSITHNTGGAGGSTANSGRNDFGTIANYRDAAGAVATALPATNDDLVIAEGADDILYSLPQVALRSLNLSTLRREAGHTGKIGQPERGYALHVNVNGTGAKYVSINARNGGEVYWKGISPDVIIRGSVGGGRSVRIGGDVDRARVLGAFVRGTVRFDDGMTLDEVHCIGVRAATVVVGTGIASFDLVEADSGALDVATNPATTKINGTAQLQLRGSGNFSLAEVRGSAELVYRGEGDNTGSWLQTGGLVDLRPVSSVAMGTVLVEGGLFTDRNSENAITYTSVSVPGGAAQVAGVSTDYI